MYVYFKISKKNSTIPVPPLQIPSLLTIDRYLKLNVRLKDKWKITMN